MRISAFFFILLSPFLAHADFIAWGSTNAVVPDPIRENFLSGFQLGLETESKKGAFQSLVKIYLDESKSQTSALDVAKKAVEDGAAALIGFPGSHDAMLAARIAQQKSITAISPGCNHQGLADFGPTVHTTGHSGKTEVASSIWFIGQYLKGQGLIIVNPRGAPSANIGDLFQQQAESSASTGIKYTIAKLDNELKLPIEILERLKKQEFSYLVFTPYPDDLRQVVAQLTDHKIDLPTLAGSAWGTVNSDIMRRYVVSKKAAFYMMTSWSSDTKAGKAFIRKFKSKFAKDPSADSAYGYDLGSIVGQVLKRIKGPLTNQSFSSALSSNLCFERLSIGQLCLSPTGGHAQRSIFFLKYSEKGFASFAEKK